MSRHEGVSCDSCLKGNFRGRRYKCLICYDYDLCAACYETGATSTRHTTDHAMQCILTRSDFDLFYGGESLGVDQPQAFTCPFCSRPGFTEVTLEEHVMGEHGDSSIEVVCPVCAALPGGDPNFVTDDFSGHFSLVHQAPREYEEPSGGIRHVRRIPHSGRGTSNARIRRNHPQYNNSAIPSLSTNSNRSENMDPIAELLSQLSSVRNRAAAAQSVSSQLQQLEMQLQSTRQQLERLPRRGTVSSVANSLAAVADSASHTKNTSNSASIPSSLTSVGSAGSSALINSLPSTNLMDFSSLASNNLLSSTADSNSGALTDSQFLLTRYGDVELNDTELKALEIEKINKSNFMQELLLSSLTETLRIEGNSSPIFSTNSLSGSDSELSNSIENESSGSNLESAVSTGTAAITSNTLTSQATLNLSPSYSSEKKSVAKSLSKSDCNLKKTAKETTTHPATN